MEHAHTPHGGNRGVGVSDTSVCKWARSFDSERRVSKADALANAAQEKQAQESCVQPAEAFKGLKNDIFHELRRRLDEDKDSLSVMDLIYVLRVLKTDLGESITIVAGKPKTQVTNPFEDIVNALFAPIDGIRPASVSS